jgi:peptidoglycan-N-acetylglucosamine deacetylase
VTKGRLTLLAAAALAVLAAGASTGSGAATRASGQSLDRLIRSGRPVYCGGGGWRAVALTFDDGPGPYSTALVNLLRRHDARATFFLVGNRLARWEDGARREMTVGELGDHTWAHAPLPRLSHKAAVWAIEHTRQEIRRRTGQSVRLFRPPYGRITHRLERFLVAKGMIDVLWNVDAVDYPRGTSPGSIVARVKAGLRPGAIIILHEIYPQSIEATRRLLPLLRARNLRAVTVSELLERDPPSRAQQRTGRGRCRRS